MAKSSSAHPSKRARPVEKFDFFHDERVRSVFYQLVTALIVGWLCWYLFSNTAENLASRGMSSGFDFLSSSAGFDVDFKLVDYTPGIGTYGDIFIIGALNTLFISLLAIVLSTLLGFVLGVLRLSNNWLVSKVALAYVEIFRNIPLLIQVVFWYIGVFNLLPVVRKTIDLSFGSEMLLINNRGLYFATPQLGELFWFSIVALVVAVLAIWIIRYRARRLQIASGVQKPTFAISLAILIALPSAAFMLSGSPLSWDKPILEGFNFVGGATLPPAFLALLVALGMYHSAQIAETVRAGILSVNRGQHDAAMSIGLKPGRVMSLVIIPQAMPAIVPPLISQWMNTVKNSSLAIAIGYADIVSLFMQTGLNQAGHAVEMVAMTMGFYMFISLTISWLLNIYNKRVQLVER